MIRISHYALALSVFVLAVSSNPALSLAQSIAPDAGQSLRNIERQPSALPDSKRTVTISRGGMTGPATTNQTTRIPVKAIRIEGNSAFDTATLHDLVKDFEGGSHTLAALDHAAARITDYYRDHDFMVARAYIPAQRMENGILAIRVLEGKMDYVTLKNRSRIDDAKAEKYIDAQVQKGQNLKNDSIDRALLLLADTPGVGGARATLRPGQSVGTSELVVDLDQAKPYSGYISVDNHGNRYTGEYRLDSAVAFNGLVGQGDQLALRALGSNENLAYGRIGYSVPIGYNGLRVGASYASNWYELGQEFSALNARGRAEISSLYVTYPFIRTLKGSLYSSASLEHKRLKDRTGTPYSASDRKVQLASVGLSGNYYDSFAGGGVTSMETSLAGGELSMDATSLAIDSATAKSDGGFGRVTYSLNRLQRVTDKNTLYAGVWGQQANKNLNSSEEISLGGANAVRAYPQGESNGDEGWVSTVELRHDLPTTKFAPALQAVAFYDIGSIAVNHEDYNADKNSRTISGAGLGLNATIIQDVQLQSFVAWRTSGGNPRSDSDDRVPRLWFQVSKRF